MSESLDVTPPTLFKSPRDLPFIVVVVNNAVSVGLPTAADKIALEKVVQFT